MKIVILDNYDSFTYNLYQYVAELNGKPLVYRNDALTLDQLRDLNPDRIIISPVQKSRRPELLWHMQASHLDLGPTVLILECV
jgi:anthranilate/para-aminobenzoate synthase component II